MEQLIGPENLDFIVKHSWTWYLIGAVILQMLLIFWAVTVIRRKSAEIKDLKSGHVSITATLAKADKFSISLQDTVAEKESMITALQQQLANTKQLMMDGLEEYFAKKNGEVTPAE